MSKQITYRVIKESSNNGTLSGTMVELWHAPEDPVNLPWQVWKHSYKGRATSDPVIIAAFGHQQVADAYLASLPDARATIAKATGH